MVVWSALTGVDNCIDESVWVPSMLRSPSWREYGVASFGVPVIRRRLSNALCLSATSRVEHGKTCHPQVRESKPVDDI